VVDVTDVVKGQDPMALSPATSFASARNWAIRPVPFLHTTQFVFANSENIALFL